MATKVTKKKAGKASKALKTLKTKQPAQFKLEKMGVNYEAEIVKARISLVQDKKPVSQLWISICPDYKAWKDAKNLSISDIETVLKGIL